VRKALAALVLIAFPLLALCADEQKPYTIPLIGLDGKVYALTVTPHAGETRRALICFEMQDGDFNCVVDDHGVAARATLSKTKESHPT
jgi:hypothetical protein